MEGERERRDLGIRRKEAERGRESREEKQRHSIVQP